ncbi:uL30 family ribosomal protein [Candidatus Woesearchaeota archaeon]|nr:uL30 family ribosomal protein [Candidatus Woesearchaeota archaeon]
MAEETQEQSQQPAPAEKSAPAKKEAPAKQAASKQAASKQAAPKQAAQAAPKPQGGKIAVILIRNTVRAPNAILDTLNMLKLYKKNTCVVLDSTPANMGMIKKVKDYVTYGEADSQTIKLLEEKRGNKNKEGKTKGIFTLSPPRGGFERKGIKRSYNVGGALGYRRDKINQLIQKMI